MGTEIWFPGKRIANPNTHGTGCTLSSAIAANLAKGFALKEAIARAKAYLTDALNAQLDLGRGSGPLDHTLGGVGGRKIGCTASRTLFINKESVFSEDF